MKKKFLLAGLTSLCLACSVAGFAACAPDAPEAQEGTIYQTGVETFWVGVGKAYMTFEYAEEPETPEEDTLYGYVFNVNVDSGDGYSSWLAGNWELSEDESTLTLTATWEEGDNSTYLADATSGQAKTYTAENGEFTIGVNLPSAGTINFTLNLEEDKMGEGETPEPEEPCTEHVDADGDGKCDKCGENMPNTPPAENEVQLTMKSEANQAGQIGRILMYSDNTWEFSVCFYGDTYNPMASGTWEIRQDFSAIDLTVTSDQANVLGGNDIVVTMDASDPADIQYTTTINCNIPQVGELSFTMTKVANEEEPTPPTPPTPSDDTLKSEEASFWGGVGKAYIEFDTENNAFSVKVNAGDGNFAPWLSGTFTLADDQLTLTANWDLQSAATLTGGTSGEAKIYNANNGVYVIGVDITQAGTVNFEFVPDPSAVQEDIHYTVIFDLGNGSKTEVETSTFKMEDGTKKQYLPVTAAPTIPNITGKRFAGWDTSATPVLKDGVSETIFILGTKINEYGSMMGTVPIENDVMEVTEDMTLYARWVTPTKVSNAEELKDIKNDLNGWYVLQNDITLTGEWMPIGIYYGSYEFLDTGWWKYAFGGVLDGNGYSIKGLNISTLTPYGDIVHPEEGTGNGTTGLFGSICNASITDLVIENPVVDISDYTGAFHGYASIVAAFVQGADTKIANVYVKDAKITINATDIAYMAVSGLLAGHWGGTLANCFASGTITVNVDYSANYNQSATNLYVGGLVGEGYCWVDNCQSDMTVNLNVKDVRAAVAPTPPATAPVINVYMGAIGASAAYTANDMASGALNLDFYEVANTAVAAYVGGIAGIQRYGYLDYTTADTSIAVTTNSKDGNTIYVGSLLGGYDPITSLLYLHGTNDMKARQCTDLGVNYTLDSEQKVVEFIGYAPKTEEEMAMGLMIAEFMGVDLSVYKDADGNYDIYGTDRCIKVSNE